MNNGSKVVKVRKKIIAGVAISTLVISALAVSGCYGYKNGVKKIKEVVENEDAVSPVIDDRDDPHNSAQITPQPSTSNDTVEETNDNNSDISSSTEEETNTVTEEETNTEEVVVVVETPVNESTTPTESNTTPAESNTTPVESNTQPALAEHNHTYGNWVGYNGSWEINYCTFVDEYGNKCEWFITQPHNNYTDWVKIDENTLSRVCNDCGYNQVYTYEVCEHKYNEFSSYNKTWEARYCQNPGCSHIDYREHDYDEWVEYETGKMRTCKNCGNVEVFDYFISDADVPKKRTLC